MECEFGQSERKQFWFDLCANLNTVKRYRTDNSRLNPDPGDIVLPIPIVD